MRAKAMPGEDASTLPTPDDVAPLIVEMLSPGFTAMGEQVNYRDWAEQTSA